jgi:hypothetical protein
MDTLDILSATFSLARLDLRQRSAFVEISPDLITSFARYAYKECRGTPVGSVALCDLFERVESSDLSLSEWVTQIVGVYQWLEQNNLYAALSDIVQYVSCACHGAESQSRYNVDWYLENFGFERSFSRDKPLPYTNQS